MKRTASSEPTTKGTINNGLLSGEEKEDVRIYRPGRIDKAKFGACGEANATEFEIRTDVFRRVAFLIPRAEIEARELDAFLLSHCLLQFRLEVVVAGDVQRAVDHV